MPKRKKKQQEPETTPERDVELSTGGRPKRASAIKARHFIQKSTKVRKGDSDATDDDSDSVHYSDDGDASDDFVDEDAEQDIRLERSITRSDDPEQEKKREANEMQRLRKAVLDFWSEFTIAPGQLRTLEPGMLKQWKRHLEKADYVHCPFSTCDLKYTTVPGLNYHFKRCGVPKSFGCKLCSFVCESGTQRGLVEHLNLNHQSDLPELPEELKVVTKPRPPPEPKRQSNTCKPADINKKFSFLSVKGYAIEDTISFRKLVEKPNLFVDLLPKMDQWKSQPENACSMFMPQSKESVPVKFPGDKAWKKLPLFESQGQNDHVTFFVGGPVWSSAWCPMPLNNDNEKQYLVLASCVNFEAVHPICDEDAELGLIQLWDFDKLSLNKRSVSIDEHREDRVKFSLGITHSYGVIYEMEWCPLGNTWQSINSETVQRNRCLPRLGLLALACADGQVRILSVPHPDSINFKPSHTNQRLICSPEPCVILDPPGIGPSINFEPTACRCISWSSTNCNHIVAGYGSGVVALWNIGTSTRLLTVNQNDKMPFVETIVLSPSLSWTAHSSAVNCLSFSPWPEEDYLTTGGGIDRDLKVWDMGDLAAPIRSVHRAIVTQVCWTFRWPGPIISHDDGFANQHQIPVTFRDLFDGSDKTSLTTHRSCVWGLDYSDWTNSEVSVDAFGESGIFFNFYYKYDGRGRSTCIKKLPLYSLKSEELEQHSGSRTTNNYDNHSKSIFYDYQHITSNRGLKFIDSPLVEMIETTESNSHKAKEKIRIDCEHPSNYPLVALTQARWNPNKQAYTWIFTGGQAGLCRISCYAALSQTVNDQINETGSG